MTDNLTHTSLLSSPTNEDGGLVLRAGFSAKSTFAFEPASLTFSAAREASILSASRVARLDRAIFGSLASTGALKPGASRLSQV